MTSEPGSVTSKAPDPNQDDPLQSAKIPLKQKGLDIASQMRSVAQAEPDLARAIGDYSSSVEQTLGVIEAIETTLQHKRRQIDVIQARQKVLAREYKELGKTLELATKDLARQFAGIIRDLEANLPIVKPAPKEGSETRETAAQRPADGAAETTASAVETEAAKASEASDAADTPPADAKAAPEEDSGLDLDTADLPPVPEFLGDRQDPPNAKDDKASEDSGLGMRGWWKQGKK